MKFTDKGIKDIKNAPQRIENGIKAWEAMGGKLIGFYAVMRECDYVAVGETSSDEVAMTFNMSLGVAGNVRTIMLKVFTKEELTEISLR